MRRFFLILACVGVAFGVSLLAQVPNGVGISSRPRMPFYRTTPDGKKVLDALVLGSNVTNRDGRTLVITDFEMKRFKDGDDKAVQIIAQSPECEMNPSNHVATGPGQLRIFTPTTNLYVQGEGFMYLEANHFLAISNKVETRILKSMLKAPLLGEARTNTLTGAPEKILIYSDFATFDLESNIVHYAGNVHMIDPQLDLTSHMLVIQLGSNGTVESIVAQKDVVLTTTNNGQATGAEGIYYVTNGMLTLHSNAAWHNGDQEAKAEQFTYDSVRHLLTGSGHVRVQWPNEPSRGTIVAIPTRVNTNGYRKLFTDFAILQFPPTNGPVESMHARGHVILINQEDESRALSDKADYERRLDQVVLTGNPVWKNQKMEVDAEVLSANLGGRTYFARTNAHFKTMVGATNRPANSNQWLHIASDTMEYRTNEARFMDHVEARLLQNKVMQEALDCALLTLQMTNNEISGAFASGKVAGRTAPDRAGMIKTIHCATLNAYPAAKRGILKSVDAHNHVVIEETSTKDASFTNRLTADNVRALFSPLTNHIDEALADHHVIMDQFKDGKLTHATSDQAEYTTGTNDIVRLTGHPFADRENFSIANAQYMLWEPKFGKFGAYGQYTIVPKKAVKTPF